MTHWEGSQYRRFKDADLKTVAKRIKADIQGKYPDISVSVGSEHYSQGCSVNIKVTAWRGAAIMVKRVNAYGFADYPYSEEARALLNGIQDIANQYNYDRSEGMEDYWDSRFHCTPEFAWELREREERGFGLRV